MVAAIMGFLWVLLYFFPDPFAPPVSAETAVHMFLGFTALFTSFDIIAKMLRKLEPKWFR